MKLRGAAIEWQTNVDDIVGRETLERTRKADPEKYATVKKKWNEDNRALGVEPSFDLGAGFWVNVRMEGETGAMRIRRKASRFLYR
jgi:hypothetical protein